MASGWKGLVNLGSVTMKNKEISLSFAFSITIFIITLPR